ncbi:hypothetical protein J4558_25865 [Leptolyngbya sp. 15MV]|nr:hypothetical protein J4558_25865 [Leptolyngbya sp. 15MV]
MRRRKPGDGHADAHDPIARRQPSQAARRPGEDCEEALATVPAAFRLPLEVAFNTTPPAGSEANGSPGPKATAFKVATLDITQRKQSIRIPVEQKPASVTFDPDQKIPLIDIKAK